MAGFRYECHIHTCRGRSAGRCCYRSPVKAAVRHWHGAAPDHFMTHLSITEAVPGDARPDADWGEHVTDAEYNGS